MTQLENDKKQIQDAIICECGLTFQAIHIGNCEKYITKGSLYVNKTPSLNRSIVSNNCSCSMDACALTANCSSLSFVKATTIFLM